MGMETNVAKRSSGSLTIVQPSSKGCLAQMLDLAAKMMGYELMSGELVIWENALSKQPPEGIQWAFTEHLKAGQYFPKPAEILGRIGQWHTQRRDSEQQQEMDAARWTRERLRAEGQPAGEDQVAAIQKHLLEVALKWPEPLPAMRRVELKERLARARAEREASKHAVAEKVRIPEHIQRQPFVTPALHLTPEEIQARREREREEIRKCREES